MPPRYRLEHEVVLNEFLNFDQVGTYQLVVTFGGRIEPQERTARLVVPSTRSFELTMGPRDEAVLGRICRVLLSGAASANAQERIPAVRRIAWIRDDAAVPCIRQAIELDYSSGALWDALLRIGSPAAGEAIEALAGSSDPGLSALAKARLVEFRRRRRPESLPERIRFGGG